MYLTTHPAVVNILNLGPGNLHILTHVLSNGFAALGGDGVLLCGAVGGRDRGEDLRTEADRPEGQQQAEREWLQPGGRG